MCVNLAVSDLLLFTQLRSIRSFLAEHLPPKNRIVLIDDLENGLASKMYGLKYVLVCIHVCLLIWLHLCLTCVAVCVFECLSLGFWVCLCEVLFASGWVVFIFLKNNSWQATESTLDIQVFPTMFSNAELSNVGFSDITFSNACVGIFDVDLNQHWNWNNQRRTALKTQTLEKTNVENFNFRRRNFQRW